MQQAFHDNYRLSCCVIRMSFQKTVFVCGEFDSLPKKARAFKGKNTLPVSQHFYSFGLDDIHYACINTLDELK